MVWTKMTKVTGGYGPLKNGRPMTWQDYAEAGVPKNTAKKIMRKISVDTSRREMYTNDLYNCNVVRKFFSDGVGVELTELSITRIDRSAIHDWRHLQRIKNDVLGEDVEAVEIYPAEDRLVDTANTYWLYAFPSGVRIPFGMQDRAIANPEKAAKFGAVQRKFEDGV